MKKSTVICMLISIISSLSYLTYSSNSMKFIDSDLNQLGAGAIWIACESEGASAGGWTAVGGILIGTGVGVITTSAPVSWSPVGWLGLGAGLIL